MNMDPQIAVVIPCYDHAAELAKTLEALVKQTITPIEVVVVDDGSHDDAKNVVDRFMDQLPIAYIRFEKNRGAPAARNEGARTTTAPLIIFLDADAELIPNALETFAKALEDHPEASYAYADFTWGNRLFRSRTFDPDVLKERNYIHTSSLIRREDLPGFDEALTKFQDWDLWLTMAEQGHPGVWVDQVLYRIEPRREGMSRWLPRFMHRIPWQVIGWTPSEVARYRDAESRIREKHLLRVKRGVDLTIWIRWAALTLFLEIVSALTIFHPTPNTVACIVLGVIIFRLGWKKPTIGLGILLLELLIGSKGYLLQAGVWPDTISLRIILTGAFGLGWLVNFIRYGKLSDLIFAFRTRKGYLLLFILIGWATLRGILMGNGSVMSDGNAWADWALLLPVLDIAYRYRDRIRKDLAPVFVIGVLWLAVKTLGLEYVFSHGFKAIATGTYLWVRRTGVGEVTLMLVNAFRIFMQSYIYAIVACLTAVAWWMTNEKGGGSREWGAGKWIAWWTMTASSAVILISLSRSFWIGSAVGFLGICAYLVITRKMVWKRLVGPILAGVAGLAAIGLVISFPLPPVPYANLAQIFGERADLGEAAAVSRWNLLPVLDAKIAEHPILGSGFGATVTYKTDDPRILAEHPDGMYTTYAFEWGWLEHWIKFGILGIPVILWLLVSLAIRLWKTADPLWVRLGAVFGLITLGVVHVFTPYLNHPLGFLFFFVGEGLILSAPIKESHSKTLA